MTCSVSTAVRPKECKMKKRYEAQQTESPEFKAWFGNSKVVNSDGSPKVVYHGGKGGIKAFESGSYNGIYFTESPEAADAYAEQIEPMGIYPAYLSIQNPAHLDSDKKAQEIALSAIDSEAKTIDEYIDFGSEVWMLLEGEEGEWVLEALKKAGYDGATILEDFSLSWVVFEPHQIKSAIGNVGAFDPKSPDITAQQDMPNVLYHATFEPLLDSIMQDGLGATRDTMWDESKPGVVYMSEYPDRAEYYPKEVVRNADQDTGIVEPDWVDKIVVLEIDATGLDKDKLKQDEYFLNLYGEESDMWEYHGIIPPSLININTKNRQAQQTESPEFKAWFGNSKVVNPDGSPKVVYHGTTGGAYNEFRVPAWFDEGLEVPEEIASGEGGVISSVYLSIKNPYITHDSEEWGEGPYNSEFVNELKSKWYDGIKGETSFAPSVWIAFEPSQIKSAIGNVGTFDPASPDITAMKKRYEAKDTATELEEMFGSEDKMGIKYDEEVGASFLPDGGQFGHCTTGAWYVVDKLGRGKVVGFSGEDNPSAQANTVGCGGHDFAIIDNRFIVDPWIMAYGDADKAVFDMENARDNSEISRLYGDPKSWTELDRNKREAQHEGRYVIFNPYTSPPEGSGDGWGVVDESGNVVEGFAEQYKHPENIAKYTDPRKAWDDAERLWGAPLRFGALNYLQDDGGALRVADWAIKDMNSGEYHSDNGNFISSINGIKHIGLLRFAEKTIDWLRENNPDRELEIIEVFENPETGQMEERFIDPQSAVNRPEGFKPRYSQIKVTEPMRQIAADALEALEKNAPALVNDETYKRGAFPVFFQAQVPTEDGMEEVEFSVNNNPAARSLEFGNLTYDKRDGKGYVVLYMDEAEFEQLKWKKKDWYYLMIHELVHAVDPKFDVYSEQEMKEKEKHVWDLSNKWRKTKLDKDLIDFMDTYLDLPWERDAWIAQMSEEVIDYYINYYATWRSVKRELRNYRPRTVMERNMSRNKNLWRDYLKYLYAQLEKLYRDKPDAEEDWKTYEPTLVDHESDWILPEEWEELSKEEREWYEDFYFDYEDDWRKGVKKRKANYRLEITSPTGMVTEPDDVFNTEEEAKEWYTDFTTQDAMDEHYGEDMIKAWEELRGDEPYDNDTAYDDDEVRDRASDLNFQYADTYTYKITPVPNLIDLSEDLSEGLRKGSAMFMGGMYSRIGIYREYEDEHPALEIKENGPSYEIFVVDPYTGERSNTSTVLLPEPQTKNEDLVRYVNTYLDNLKTTPPVDKPEGFKPRYSTRVEDVVAELRSGVRDITVDGMPLHVVEDTLPDERRSFVVIPYDKEKQEWSLGAGPFITYVLYPLEPQHIRVFYHPPATTAFTRPAHDSYDTFPMDEWGDVLLAIKRFMSGPKKIVDKPEDFKPRYSKKRVARKYTIILKTPLGEKMAYDEFNTEEGAEQAAVDWYKGVLDKVLDKLNDDVPKEIIGIFKDRGEEFNENNSEHFDEFQKYFDERYRVERDRFDFRVVRIPDLNDLYRRVAPTVHGIDGLNIYTNNDGVLSIYKKDRGKPKEDIVWITRNMQGQMAVPDRTYKVEYIKDGKTIEQNEFAVEDEYDAVLYIQDLIRRDIYGNVDRPEGFKPRYSMKRDALTDEDGPFGIYIEPDDSPSYWVDNEYTSLEDADEYAMNIQDQVRDNAWPYWWAEARGTVEKYHRIVHEEMHGDDVEFVFDEDKFYDEINEKVFEKEDEYFTDDYKIIVKPIADLEKIESYLEKHIQVDLIEYKVDNVVVSEFKQVQNTIDPADIVEVENDIIYVGRSDSDKAEYVVEADYSGKNNQSSPPYDIREIGRFDVGEEKELAELVQKTFWEVAEGVPEIGRPEGFTPRYSKRRKAFMEFKKEVLRRLNRYRNTKVWVADDGALYIKLHQTVIVKITPDGQVTLSSGGWKTPTTKNHINEVAHELGLDFGIYQRNYEWFIDYKGQQMPFEDGMVLDFAGELDAIIEKPEGFLPRYSRKREAGVFRLVMKVYGDELPHHKEYPSYSDALLAAHEWHMDMRKHERQNAIDIANEEANLVFENEGVLYNISEEDIDKKLDEIMEDYDFEIVAADIDKPEGFRPRYSQHDTLHAVLGEMDGSDFRHIYINDWNGEVAFKWLNDDYEDYRFVLQFGPGTIRLFYIPLDDWISEKKNFTPIGVLHNSMIEPIKTSLFPWIKEKISSSIKPHEDVDRPEGFKPRYSQLDTLQYIYDKMTTGAGRQFYPEYVNFINKENNFVYFHYNHPAYSNYGFAFGHEGHGNWVLWLNKTDEAGNDNLRIAQVSGDGILPLDEKFFPWLKRMIEDRVEEHAMAEVKKPEDFQPRYSQRMNHAALLTIGEELEDLFGYIVYETVFDNTGALEPYIKFGTNDGDNYILEGNDNKKVFTLREANTDILGEYPYFKAYPFNNNLIPWIVTQVRSMAMQPIVEVRDMGEGLIPSRTSQLESGYIIADRDSGQRLEKGPMGIQTAEWVHTDFPVLEREKLYVFSDPIQALKEAEERFGEAKSIRMYYMEGDGAAKRAHGFMLMNMDTRKFVPLSPYDNIIVRSVTKDRAERGQVDWNMKQPNKEIRMVEVYFDVNDSTNKPLPGYTPETVDKPEGFTPRYSYRRAQEWDKYVSEHQKMSDTYDVATLQANADASREDPPVVMTFLVYDRGLESIENTEELLELQEYLRYEKPQFDRMLRALENEEGQLFTERAVENEMRWKFEGDMDTIDQQPEYDDAYDYIMWEARKFAPRALETYMNKHSREENLDMLRSLAVGEFPKDLMRELGTQFNPKYPVGQSYLIEIDEVPFVEPLVGMLDADRLYEYVYAGETEKLDEMGYEVVDHPLLGEETLVNKNTGGAIINNEMLFNYYEIGKGKTIYKNTQQNFAADLPEPMVEMYYGTTMSHAKEMFPGLIRTAAFSKESPDEPYNKVDDQEVKDEKSMRKVIKLRNKVEKEEQQKGTDLGKGPHLRIGQMDYLKRAKELYGVTENISDAAYILPDGEMLDFSEGGVMRTLDHRNVGNVFEDVKESIGATEGMHKFMDLGAVRITPEDGGVDIRVPPTGEQYQKILEFLYYYDEPRVDVYHNGRQYSLEYYVNASHRVVNDIKRIFKGEKVIEGNFMNLHIAQAAPNTQFKGYEYMPYRGMPDKGGPPDGYSHGGTPDPLYFKDNNKSNVLRNDTKYDDPQTENIQQVWLRARERIFLPGDQVLPENAILVVLKNEDSGISTVLDVVDAVEKDGDFVGMNIPNELITRFFFEIPPQGNILPASTDYPYVQGTELDDSPERSVDQSFWGINRDRREVI